MESHKTFLQVGSVYSHSRSLVYWTTHNGVGGHLHLVHKELLVLEHLERERQYPWSSPTWAVLVDGMKLFMNIDCELAEQVFVKLT